MAPFHIRISHFPLMLLLVLGLISCGVVDDAGQGVNEAPRVVGGADQIVDEQTTVTLTSSVTDDFEGIQSSTWQQISGPTVALQGADSTAAMFVAPQVLVQNSPQVLEFQFTVKDNFGESASAIVRVAVQAVNISPVAVEDSDSVDEGSMVTLNVTDNDADQDGKIVLDGIEIVTAPVSGTAVANSDGTITYTHDGAEALTDSFTYTVQDNETTASNPAMVSITVNPINDPPLAQAGILVINEDAKNAGGALSATDPDSTVVFFRVSDATHGSVKVSSNGAYTYRPDTNFSGNDSFTFGVTDGESNSTARVTITVNPVNDTPRFTSSASKTAEVGELYTYNIVAVDEEGDGLSITAATLPSWLNFTDNGGGKATLSGTPGAGHVGNNAVRLVVTDNGSPPKAGSQSFTIVVATNDPPKFTSTAPKTATEGQSYTYKIVATDPDGDALTITAPTFPGWLSFTDNGNGKATLSGTPGAGDVGSHSVTLQVKDDGTPAMTASQSFTIVVSEAANAPPQFTSSAPTSATQGKSYTYKIVATDPDDDTLTISVLTRPGWLSFTDNGDGKATLTGIPGAGNVGNNSVVLQVTDDGAPALKATQSFIIVVSGINAAPRFTSSPITSATVGTLYNYPIKAEDPEKDAMTITAPTRPSWLVLVPAGNGAATLRGIPQTEHIGSHSVALSVTDGTSTPATQNFSIVVAAATTQAEVLHSASSSCWSTPQDRALVASLASAEFSSLSTFSITRDAEKGRVTLIDPTTGVFEYVPNQNGPRGLDGFTYQVDDPRSGVEIRVANVVVQQRLMALGDEITEGVQDAINAQPVASQRSGYRRTLHAQLVQVGYSVDMVGSQVAGYGIAGFDADHEGHSGWTADEIAYGRELEGADGVYQWLESNPADVVLLHAGTYGLNTSPAGVAAILDEIDRWEASANGNPVKVILARIIDQNPSNPDVQTFNENLQTMVQGRVNNSEHVAYPDDIIVVDQTSALSYPADLNDALHPHATGYVKMAQPWYDVLTDATLKILDRCP